MSGDDRRLKLEKLRADGIEPFPHEFPRVVPIARIHEAHDDLAEGDETDFAYRVAGRIHARRGHGKAAFIDLDDRAGRIQLHARADLLGDESHERLLSLDLGDLIGVDGTAFKTRRGELSLRVDSWQLLAKVAAPAAREVPRARGRRDALPPPRAGPDRQRGGPRALRHAVEGRLRDPTLARRARLPGGRDPGPAAAVRRRARTAVHHPSQRTGQGPLSADRH